MNQVKTDLSKLQTFVKSLDDRHVVKVGIFGAKNSRNGSGKTNADIGAKHEFGSYSDHIPMRSFLRMPLFAKSENIVKEASVGSLALLAEGKIVTVLKRLGIACENAIQEAFGSGGFGSWKPITMFTRSKKHSSQILIDTAQMRRSISSKVEAV